MKVIQNKKRVTQEEKKQVKAAQTVAAQDPEAVYEVVMNPGKRAVRDGADIMGDVGFYTISLSCLPSLINQTIGTFGLDQAELTRDQQFDLILRYKNIYHLLLLTATTIDQTLEKIDSIPIFIKDEPETEEEIAK